MPVDAISPEDGGRAGLTLIVHSADFERIHYALAMAAAAAAIARPVTLFFTMGALAALRAADEDGTAGWRALSGGTGEPARALDTRYADAGMGGFETLLQASVELGVRFMLCEAGLKIQGIARAELRGDIPFEVGGLATLFLEQTPGESQLFI